MQTYKILGTASLFVASALGSAVAQTAQQTQQQATPTQSSDPAAASSNPDNSGTYATGKPLEMQSKEGFWGHINPFARKKWVHRQIDPVKDRANELDQLQAKNANDIRDVDGRATAGVNRAMTAANQADAHAADAASRADRASSLATTADGKTTALSGTVANLDQYQKVSSTTLPFVKGRTALSSKAKTDLDNVATSLASEKGYIVEVQGYSRSGVAASQAMADSVVRYLVTAHQIPVYRIYRTGLGSSKVTASSTSTTDEKAVVNGVRVTILHNSLAAMNEQPGTSRIGAYSPPNGLNSSSSPQQ